MHCVLWLGIKNSCNVQVKKVKRCVNKMDNVLLGVCVGDALGAPLEFLRRLPTGDEIANALLMKGGGIIGVHPGQVTDDSEMMLCLYKSIVTETDAFSLYKQWMYSGPIDMGTTTRRALNGIEPTYESQSNGALMRCAPIGVLYNKESDFFIAQKAIEDASLTHANTNVKYACACYCIAIANCLNGRNGYKAAYKWLLNKAGYENVMEWLQESLDPDLDVHCLKNIGYIRWGFTLAFWHLNMKSKFLDAMIDTMKRGGDTDTNCAIVGGLVASTQTVPPYLIYSVLHSQSDRPVWLHPKTYF